MKEFLLVCITVILYVIMLVLLQTIGLPDKKECGDYADWMTQYAPVRCLNHFITTP